MLIIPVIDLLNGSVVHARKGERDHYQIIQSQLTASSSPLAVAKALLEYYPFQQLYIADLNAIQKKNGNNLRLIKNIAKQHPNTKIWVDAGISTSDDLATWSNHNFNLILGSENFANLENYLAISRSLKMNFTLSLDFMPNGYQGPWELINNSQYWPENIILMSLPNVGANQGINLELLKQYQAYQHNFNFYAAGGVRNHSDLATLKQMGIHGALIASALHHQQISAAEIRNLSQ